MKVDKRALRDALAAALERERDTMVAQRISSEGVTHEDGRAEGSKDMRATEASYIARGQALRAEALEADVARVKGMPLRAFTPDDVIAISAVVRLVGDGGAAQLVFLAPAGGGTRLASAAGEIQVITPQSPLGRALVGATQGETIEVERAAATEEL